MKRYLLAAALLVSASQAHANFDAVIVARHYIDAIDLSVGPEPSTVSDFLRWHPPTNVWRLPTYPPQLMAEFTVVNAQGERLKIVQKIAAGLEVGAHVTVTQVDGTMRLVVPAQDK